MPGVILLQAVSETITTSRCQATYSQPLTSCSWPVQHDIVLKVTATAICGSDLHLYEGAMLQMQKGDVLGHEFMGIVEQVGPDVKSVKKGDRVVTAFDIGMPAKDGACFSFAWSNDHTCLHFAFCICPPPVAQHATHNCVECDSTIIDEPHGSIVWHMYLCCVGSSRGFTQLQLQL